MFPTVAHVLRALHLRGFRYMAEEVRAMLQDKDTLMGVINAAHDARVARLDAKEDELRTLEDR